MAQNEQADAIARAWHLHREGRQNDAIKGFEAVLKAVPDHIDANYGLGLAQRAGGAKESALESFKSAARLVSREMETNPVSRYQMLQRMVQQRINELTQPSK
jgi:tetratricopeptide (TPR) repeat protein